MNTLLKIPYRARLFTISLMLLGSICWADNFHNLDFEISQSNSIKPLAWCLTANGSVSGIDTSVGYSGQASLRLTCEAEMQEAYAVTMFPITIAPHTHLKLIGYIKATNVVDSAMLWIGDSSQSNTANGEFHVVSGTCEWTRMKLEYNTGNTSSNIIIRCKLFGKGSVWFDALSLSFNDQNYIDTLYTTVSQKEIFLLAQDTRSLNPDCNTSENKDLECLFETANKSSVIALGEVTHGASEIHKIRSRITQYLIENCKYNALAIEGAMTETYRLNNYIQNGEGNPKELIKNIGFWIWDTEEFLSTIEWLRLYNLQHSNKITIIGIDMQMYAASLDELKSLRVKYSLDTSDFAKLANLINEQANQDKQSLTVKTDYSKYWNTLSDSVNILSANDRDWYMQNLNILKQFTTPERTPLVRDMFLSDNLIWIKEHYLGSKIVVWAHNEHVRNTGPSMGQLLKSRLKDKYFSIGFAFNEGQYIAWDNGKVKDIDAVPSFPGTIEYDLNATHHPCFYIDLKNIRKNDNCPLNCKLLFRNTGAIKCCNNFKNTILANDFDGLIFIKTVSAAHLFAN